MTIPLFLGFVALFDLAIGFLIRHECIAFPGMPRTPRTDRLIDVGIIMSILAAVIGLGHLMGGG